MQCRSAAGRTRLQSYYGIDFGDRSDTTLTIINNSVGIGTTNPAYKLHVDGTMNATSVLENGAALSVKYAPSNHYILTSTANTAEYAPSNVVASLSNYAYTTNSSNTAYAANQIAIWSSNNLFNKNSGGNIAGNVGIGSATPAYNLDVNGTTRTNNLMFSQLNAGYSNISHWNFSTNGDWYIRSVNNAGKVVIQDTGGNVGIGTTSPSYKLDVSGDTD
jgi:hypothetical protein